MLTFDQRYIPYGTSKFGAFTIENIDGESNMLYRLFIDGQEKWNTTIVPHKVESPVFENPVGSFWDKIKFF